jgi:hypothetical protein
MKPVAVVYFLMVLASVSSNVNAKWEKVSEEGASSAEKYIEMESVKQAGPMSIYRQVKVLSQGSAQDLKGMSSKVELFEYDCMSSKLRILQESGYSKLWATGDALEIPVEPQAVREWHELPKSPLGLQTFNLLCPSGKDD